MKKVSIAIIGFGKGGKTLAAKLADSTHSVALIEKDPKMYGGTCINVACIPTKALMEEAKESERRGGSFAQKEKRYAEAITNKDALTGMLRGKNYHKLADNPMIQVIDGEASFLDAHHLKVGEETLEAETIIINTGSRPFVPPLPGVNLPHVYTSESLMGLSELPRRLLIVGGGYIGLEFASLYLSFGSEVTMLQVEKDFLAREDQEIAAEIEKDFQKRGLTLIKGAQTESFSEKNGVVTAKVLVEGKETAYSADAVLIATGRRPNIAGLALEKAGVALTERGGIKVDEHLKSSVDNIYAVGDVAGGLQFTYISLDDARIVLSSLKGGSRTTTNGGAVPYSVFIDPPFSRIGLSEADAKAKGSVLVGKLPAMAIPKAHILKKPQGLLKVIIDAKNHEILGAHLYCAESHEMINLIKMAMDNHLPYEYLRDEIFTHPTMSEAFNDLFASVH